MRIIEVTWKGERYEFKPEFDLFVRIEEKVAFNQITESVHLTAQGHSADMRTSHIAWILFCCLKFAGAPVRTPMEVHQSLVDRSLDYGKVLGELIIAFYGAQPERPPQTQKKTRRKKGSPHSGKT